MAVLWLRCYSVALGTVIVLSLASCGANQTVDATPRYFEKQSRAYPASAAGLTPYRTNGSPQQVTCLTFLGKTLFAGTNDGVYRGENFGESWHMISGLPAFMRIYGLTTVGPRLFAGTEMGVYRS